MKNYYCVLTFHTTQYALSTEKILKEYNIPVKLMPVPRQVSSSCGIAAEIPCEQKDKILKICYRYHVEFENFYQIEKEIKNNWFTNLLNKNQNQGDGSSG